jgi:SAM-dependent methyltransferase
MPDLRAAEDAFLPNEEDWAFALRLDEEFNRLDFRGFLERYYELAGVPDDLRRRQIAHILTAPERSQQWIEAIGPSFSMRVSTASSFSSGGCRPGWGGTGPVTPAPPSQPNPPLPGRRGKDGPIRQDHETILRTPHSARNRSGAILDLGCGTGSFLVAMGQEVQTLWGLDIAMRWLLVARKRLDEEGLAHIRLVCGCAERLPFRDQQFARIVAGDVIEHVGDQGATLAEAYRVLRPGGRLFLASPNRFSLAPEPHVRVWGVGFLPRTWMSAYVKWARGVEFRAIHTLGLGEWKRLLRRSPFGGGVIWAPGLPEGDLREFGPFKRALGQCYNGLVDGAIGQAVARRVGPLFHVVCTRPSADAGDPPANRATHPRSRRQAGPG